MRISDWSSDVCSSDLHGLAAKRRKAAYEITPGMDAHHIAKMRANIVIEFFLIDIKIGGGIGMDHRESERDRRARDVRPPKLEHPGHPIKRRRHGRAATRERVSQYGMIPHVAASFNNKHTHPPHTP